MFCDKDWRILIRKGLSPCQFLAIKHLPLEKYAYVSAYKYMHMEIIFRIKYYEFCLHGLILLPVIVWATLQAYSMIDLFWLLENVAG